jgi:hypothetical protein
VGKKRLENTRGLLFAMREVRVGAVAETADVSFFSTRGAKTLKKGDPHFL